MNYYGHRGAKGEAPENTLVGFARGLQIGLLGFETDVRLTADNEIVLLHDATVDRTTDGAGAIAELTLQEVRQLDARGRDNPDWPTPCRIPTLDEMLEMMPPEVIFEIEIKRDTPERLNILVPKLVAQLERRTTPSRITVTSFAPEALALMREAAPQWPRGFIATYDTLASVETAVTLGCAQAGIPVETSSLAIVEAAREAGLRITGWPGDTAEQLRVLRNEWRVEAITTNFPSLALAPPAA